MLKKDEYIASKIFKRIYGKPNSYIKYYYVGIWDELSEQKKSYVKKLYAEIEIRTFGANHGQDSFDLTISGILEGGRICLVFVEGEFSSILKYDELVVNNENIFFIRLMASQPKFIKRYLAGALARMLIHSGDYTYLAYRTQSPRVYQYAKALCDQLYPSLNRRSPSSHVQYIGQKLFDRFGGAGAEFDKKTFVEKSGFHDYPSSEESLMLSRHNEINNMFSEQLSFTNGDCFLVLGRLKNMGKP